MRFNASACESERGKPSRIQPCARGQRITALRGNIRCAVVRIDDVIAGLFVGQARAGLRKANARFLPWARSVAVSRRDCKRVANADYDRFVAKNVPGRDVCQVVIVCKPFALCAFAGALKTVRIWIDEATYRCANKDHTQRRLSGKVTKSSRNHFVFLLI
jgi:hypothetical protein